MDKEREDFSRSSLAIQAFLRVELLRTSTEIR